MGGFLSVWSPAMDGNGGIRHHLAVLHVLDEQIPLCAIRNHVGNLTREIDDFGPNGFVGLNAFRIGRMIAKGLFNFISFHNLLHFGHTDNNGLEFFAL